MNPKFARSNLLDAVSTLRRAGLRPFLVDGTLLGAVREGVFIAHDKDVDLGVFIEDYRPWMTQRMEVAGFSLYRTYGTPERGLQFSFKRHEIKLDTFFYYAEVGVRYHAAWLDGTPIRYDYPAFALAPLQFLDHEFLAPEQPEAFLEAKYGPDWRTPVTEWDWAWGPKNARAWVAA